MNAACSTFEVGFLARNQVQRLEHTSQSLARKEPFIAWFASRPIAFLAGLVARNVDQKANHLAEAAVWFRGARDAVIEHEGLEPLDPSFKLVDRLLKMEADLQHISDASNSLLPQGPAMINRPRKPLPAAILRMAECSAALREEVRQFRGAIMAYEADRGVQLDDEGLATVESFDSQVRKLLRAA